MTAYIFDSETTGIKDPEVIQTAWINLGDILPLRNLSEVCESWKPSKTIELGALATHHIMEEDLVACPPSSNFTLPADCTFLIGHNIDFDWTAIGKPLAPKRLCTLALARSFWPHLESHTQSALLYHFERATARNRLKSAHDALADVQNCYIILGHIIAATIDTCRSFDDLYRISQLARIPKVMPFGKHKGEPFSSIPRPYLKWLTAQPDMDQYVIAAAKGAM